MNVSHDLEEFVHAHRLHGELTWWTSPPPPTGYSVQVACPCSVTFERWVLPWDAAEDLLAEGPPTGSAAAGRVPLTAYH